MGAFSSLTLADRRAALPESKKPAAAEAGRASKRIGKSREKQLTRSRRSYRSPSRARGSHKARCRGQGCP
jgi:hypothetical protein